MSKLIILMMFSFILVNIYSSELGFLTEVENSSNLEERESNNLKLIENFFDLESIIFSGIMYIRDTEYSDFFFFIPDTVKPRIRVVADKKSFDIQYPDSSKYPETFKTIRSGVIKGTHSQFRDAFICPQDYSEFTFSMSKSVYEFSYLQIIKTKVQLTVRIKMFISWQNPTRALFVNYNFDRTKTNPLVFEEFVNYLKSLNPKAVVD